MTHTVQFVRSDLTQSRIVETAPAPLAEGAVRLRIESFAVTANNVTYAVVGDAFGYWNFFPPSAGKQDEWGIVPMWGHATVEASNHPAITVGERVYGYLPMASHLDVMPAAVTAGGFSDGAAHRQPMSPIYNQYSRLAADPEHDPAREGERMLFGPLFKTGFLIERMFRSEGWFGAQTLLCTSASSKTAMALASVTRAQSPQIRRVGLTSPDNVGFVRAGGFYDDVVTYDAIAGLPLDPSVSVDFAGNAKVLHTVHSTLDEQLNYSCTVGATHVGAGFGQDNGPIPGPAPVLFFAPHHAVAAIEALGPKGFGVAVAESWNQFLNDAGDTVQIEERSGLEAARGAFHATLTGQADPSVGIIIRP